MIALVLLAQLAASSPPVRFELPNGLRVWVQEDHSRPVALVQVTYEVGSLHDGVGSTGIAHYVEHMVYRATENIRNEDAYGYIDRIGGRYTGGTWPNFTRYAETVPAWALEAALRVTAERMSKASFDSLEFERERSNVVTEANGFREADGLSALRDSVLAAAFPAHPYGYSSNTWARDNLRLTRSAAYDWYKRYYGPNNAVLVVVGDVRANDVRALVQKHFGPLPRAPGSGEIRVVEPPQLFERRISVRFAGSRRRMEIAYRAPAARDRDYPVLVAINRVIAPELAQIARANRVEISAMDTATAYPFLYRISVAGDSTADMDRVLVGIDALFGALTTWTHATRTSAPASGGPDPERESETTNANFPARQSPLTRIANQLTDRELPRWELSPAALDSIQAAALEVRPLDVRAYARRWLGQSQRTIGLLVPGGGAGENRLDVPALTTPPARRLEPEAVPSQALQPLSPISIERVRRVLPNGVPVRAARVAGDRMALRIVVEQGDVGDTLDRHFPAAKSDSALASLAEEARLVLGRTAKTADTSDAARARGLVLRGPGPPRDMRARRTTVSIAGPRAPAELAADVERHFKSLPANGQPEPTTAASVPGASADRVRTGSPQVTIVAGLPGVPRGHPDRLALELLNYIVGVPWYGGRLGWGLTKAGLTYSSTAITTFGSASGHVLLTTTCDTRNMESTIQAITEIVAGVGEDGVTAWELQEAQGFTLGRMLLYGARERSGAEAMAVALSASEDAGLDQLDLPAWSSAYLGITLADINRVARTYYRADRLKVVAVGALPSPETPRIFPVGTFRRLFEP